MKSKLTPIIRGAAATVLTIAAAAGLIAASSKAFVQKEIVPLAIEQLETSSEQETEEVAQIVSPNRFQLGQLWENERITLPAEELSKAATESETETQEAAQNDTVNPLESFFADKALVNPQLVTSCLNMREEPDEQAALVNTLGLYAVMNIQKTEKDWSYISVNGMEGWVCSAYLLTGKEAADYLLQSAAVYARISVPNMNIRIRPSIQADILDVAYEGDVYRVVGLNGDWAYCEYADPIRGYLSADCLRVSFSYGDSWIHTDLALAQKTAAALGISIGETWAEPVSTIAETDVQTAAKDEELILPSAPSLQTETSPAALEAPTEPVQETSQAAVPETEGPVITAIEAFYRGAGKNPGDVVFRSEIYVIVGYSDGTFATVEDGWTSSDTGMMLHVGENVITVSYAGFSSNIVLTIAAPQPTEPQTQPTTPAPQPTMPAPQPTEPQTQPTTPAPQPTEPPTQPTTPAPQPTEPPTQPTTPAPQPTEPPATEPAPAGNIRVSNVPLNSALTAYTLNLCAQYGVDSSVIFSVMYHESRFNQYATSGSGAQGLMQIIPRYSAERMARLGVSDLYDPASNILVGIDILAEYYHTYGGWHQALTRYRTGVAGGTSAYASMVLGSIGMFQTVYYE